MASETQLTVPQWLDVREAVADKLKLSGSEQRIGTRTTIAENLMRSGYIDIDEVLRDLSPELEPSDGPEPEDVPAE